MVRRTIISLLIVVAVPCAYFFYLSLIASRPKNLGLNAEGKLRNCPDKPNCVCSQHHENDPKHHIQPISFTGDPLAAFKRLRHVIKSQPRVEVITSEETYLHAEFTSLIFRFVDDVECLLDAENQLIHIRSASRSGYSDLGVNRKRVEQLRTAFNEAED